MSQTGAEHAGKTKTLGGALAALGIVFGDIGTSPLYTLQTVVGASGGKTLDRTALLGAFSLLVWTMLTIVVLKYAVTVMRADNSGEGGILALLSLVGADFGRSWHSRATLLCAAGLFGAALLYGDGAITPAISVLSAIEGISVVTKAFHAYELPLAVAILVGIFAVQPFGTARIGRVFGPVMLVWFVAIGLLGIVNIGEAPGVLRGLDPVLALGFVARHGFGSLAILGAVFLSVTGAEALYADMSHVGRRSVRLSLGLVVMPTLVLSYAGQTAFLVAHPSVKDNPFFAQLPHALVLPMVLLATVATIIASQAIITGSFTLTRQAMQLGWFPGLNIRQTSDTEYGQIYVPVVNWCLAAVTVGIAIGFGSSDRLSGAYGTAVSTTMLLTTMLLLDVMRTRWHWSLARALPVFAFFGCVDLVFFVANLLKIRDGGYVPLLIGLVLFTIMTTWRRGVELVRKGLAPFGERSDTVLADLRSGALPRVPGSVVFLTRSDEPVPPFVTRYTAQFHALPEKVLVLSVRFEPVPRVDGATRMAIEEIGPEIWRATCRFGFVEMPNLFAALRAAKRLGCDIDLDEVLFLAGKDEIVADPDAPKMLPARRLLFGFLYRNAVRASDRFDLPRDRFIEIGHQVGV